MNAANPLRGHLCLAITPFSADGSIDLESQRRLALHLLGGGVEGMIVGGSTGEGFSLDADERRAIITATVEAVEARVPVIAGVLASGTDEAARSAADAVAAGASAVMVAPPSYAPTFFMTSRGLEEHFHAIASSVAPAGVMLYDGGGGVEIPADVTARVVERCSNIWAVKLTVPAPQKVEALRTVTGGRVNILCGNDALTLYELALGVDGVSLGVGNVVPRDVTDVVHGFLEGDRGRARTRFYRRVLPIASVALCATPQFIQVFKLGLRQLGVLDSDRVRLPLLPLDATRAQEAAAAFREGGLDQ